MSTTNKSFVPLHEFTVSIEKEVDQVNTRIEGEGANSKTITETVKVVKTVNVPICFKKPSRIEKEEADIERSLWETKYITQGILPRALLIKTYKNYGDIFSEEEKNKVSRLQAEIMLKNTELMKLQINQKDHKEDIENVAIRLMELRNELLDFEQEKSVFYNNTAEAKARDKLVQWYTLHLSYYRPINADESIGEWTPLFIGNDTKEKLEYYDDLVEEENVLIFKALPRLGLISAIVASSEGGVDKEALNAFLETTINE